MEAMNELVLLDFRLIYRPRRWVAGLAPGAMVKAGELMGLASCGRRWLHRAVGLICLLPFAHCYAGVIPREVANSIPENARSGLEVSSRVALPIAKASPMPSELVSIDDQPKYGEVGPSIYQVLAFCGRQFNRTIHFEPVIIARKQRRAIIPCVVLGERQGRHRISVNYLEDCVGMRRECGRFASVSYTHFDARGRVVRDHPLDSYPGPLVSFKVMTNVTPLKVSNHGVPYGAWDGDNFQESLPPAHGLIPGLLGLLAIAWGWINMRGNRRLPASGVIFLAGCVLWSYGCLVILPWSAK